MVAKAYANVLCDNWEHHMTLETDGMVWCQHCYLELKAENEQLKEYVKKIVDGHYFDPAIGISLKAVEDGVKLLEVLEKP